MVEQLGVREAVVVSENQSLKIPASINKTSRRQWTSCDNCRERKKRCDIIQMRADGSVRCTRCRDSDVPCTFDFVSRKGHGSSVRKQHARVRQTETIQGNVISSKTEPSPVDIASTSFWPEATYLWCGDRAPELIMPGSLISSTTWSLEGEGGTATGAVNDEFDGDRHMSGLTDEEMHQVLFSDQPIKELHPSSGSTTEAIVMPSPETVLNHCNAAGAAAATSFTQQSLVRTASGLSPALEWSMLCEFALMGHPQLPVVDMDMVFLRYTYSLPSPLPTYLVLSLVACGANYSARKVVPGIDVDSAAFLFELAKQEMMMVALKELCVDAISALTLVGFHWQGDLSAYERNCLLDMSVRKVQQLGLHKEPILRQGRSSREAGVVKYLVWLNYIVDAFSCVSRLSVGDIDLTKVPYNGDDIHLTHTCEEDMHAMSRDFFTGAYRPGWNITRVTKSWQYNRAFGTLAKIQNAVRNAQRIGASTHYLHCRLLEWQERYFHDLDIRKYHWEPLTGRFKEFMGMTWAVVSLNFSFWYCSLNIYFDDLRPFLCVNNDQMLPSIDTMAVGLLDESKIRGCFRCFIAMIGIFETLATGNHLLQTSQILRCQLYFGGRVLQIFYRNGVSAGPEYRVDDNLLQRWERCLEICELIWGFSARELDLSSMRLKEL